MPHEVDGAVHWHEPAGLSAAGLRRYLRPKLAYDRFMETEGLPMLRAAGVADLREVALLPWRRLGGRGAYLPLFGTEGGFGCSLLQLDAASRAEKHLFEEVVLVLEGRGTTEIWQEGADRVVFEWQPGSVFSIPPNALHRLVNAAATPSLVLCGGTLPSLLNLLGDVDAVFANPFAFAFDEETGQAFDDIEPDPVNGLALCRTGLVPDATNCDLPLDNRFSPGFRQMQLAMTGPSLLCSLGEHRPGRYARAFVPPANTVTICLRGRGFLLSWPAALGPTPWQDGHAADIVRVEQKPFAMIGSDGKRYHQLFNTGATPLRHLAWSMPQPPSGPPGEEIRDPASTELAEGGTMIPYAAEDPFIRALYAEALAGTGVTNRMRDDDYSV